MKYRGVKTTFNPQKPSQTPLPSDGGGVLKLSNFQLPNAGF
jgi:hypothetical protein